MSAQFMRNSIKNTALSCICAASLLRMPAAKALNIASIPQSNLPYTQSLTSLQVSPDVIAMISRQVAEAMQSEAETVQIDTSEKNEKVSSGEMEQMSIEELEAEIQVQQEIMDNAHDMAESARLLGLSDDSGTIQTANTFYIDAQKSLCELKSALEDKQEDLVPVFSYDIYTKSNLSADDYEVILKDTPLSGHGQDFYDMEQEWGVSGLFALAVAQGESETGAKGNLATKKNNFFGIQNHAFATEREGILFFGKLLNDPLYKGRDIESVARSYCPPTWEAWASEKRVIMRSYWKKIVAANESCSSSIQA